MAAMNGQRGNGARLLCLNAGSSSLKLALYAVDAAGETRLLGAAAQEIGRPDSGVRVDGSLRPMPLPDHRTALETLLQALELSPVDAVGHRLVHGGEHTQPERLTPALRERLEALVPLAPLHIPPALSILDAAAKHLPGVPQVACFDTAFHRTLPEIARRLPLPGRYHERGVRRYGFHGLSYEYIVRRLGERARGRLVVAHLGNGASLAALRDGRSVDTTMGLTPTGGVMMATRSGDLDPGVLLYLLREEKLEPDALEELLDARAGLLGVSGRSGDMAELLAASDPAARLAVALFCYQVRKAVGSLAAALGGLDRLVFTGGIGEHAAPVRARVCEGLAHLGIALDAAANERGAERISAANSTCPVEVIPTDEDAMIARHVHECLHRAGPG